MAKTTKQTRGIHSWIKFQKHQGVESLTIQGKDALADLSQDKNGDTNLILNADKDKVNTVASSVPYLGISHTTTGTNPNQEKTATISQDLTQFPLSGGELVTVTKEHDSLTIHDEKVKEFVNTTVTTKETEIREFIGTVKEELTTKINEHAGGSSESSNKDEFMDEILNYVEYNLPTTFFSGFTAFTSDNMHFGFTNIDGTTSGFVLTEIEISKNSKIVNKLILMNSDFNNKVIEEENMYIKLYSSDKISDGFSGADVDDPTGKGQLRLHATLKQPLGNDKYYITVKCYSRIGLKPTFSLEKIQGDGTRLTAESMTQ